jgi:hypothetical protein
MQEPIAITLQPARVTVEAGRASAQVVAIIKNQTTVVDRYVLELAGLAPEWYTLPIKNLTLFPDEQKTFNLSLQAPPGFETLDGRYEYTLRAKSTTENNRMSEAVGTLFVNLPEAINMRLKRDLVRGQEGVFDLTVTNRTQSPQLVTITGEDDEDALDFSFEPSTIQIAAGASLGVQVTTRVAAGQALVGSRAFAFRLHAQSVDEREKSNVVEAQFVYTPAQVRMELLPPRIKGVEGRFNLNIANPGTHPVGVEVSASNPDDALDIQFQIRNLVLQAGTSVILPLMVRLRAGLKPELRAYPFTVTVRQAGGGPTAPEIGPPTTGELAYEPAVEFAVLIERGDCTGMQCDYLVKIQNPSLFGLRLSVRADDPQRVLDLFFGGQIDQLTLEPESDLQIPLLARLRVAPLAAQTAFPFTVTVHGVPNDGSAPVEKTARAELVYGTTGPALGMELLPVQVRGEAGRFQVRLTSGVQNTLQVVLRGRDETNRLQYEFLPARVQLAPDHIELVELSVRFRNGTAPPGAQHCAFEVIGWVPGMGGDGAATATGTWFYQPGGAPAPAPLSIHVQPGWITGQGGQFQVTLVNQGTEPLTVVVRGSDAADALEFLFQVPRVQLQPQEVAELTVVVRGQGNAPLPGPYRYPFEISGWVPGSVTGTAGVARGELVVLEALKVPPTWPTMQRVSMAVMLLVWMLVPFLLNTVLRENEQLLNLRPLILQYLPLLIGPVVAVSLYNIAPGQIRGWKGAFLGILAMGGALTVILPLFIPATFTILGYPAALFAGVFLIPALVIILVV